MNSALMDTNVQAESWKDSVPPGIMDVAKTLLLLTMKKLQDFLQICSVRLVSRLSCRHTRRAGSFSALSNKEVGGSYFSVYVEHQL